MADYEEKNDIEAAGKTASGVPVLSADAHAAMVTEPAQPISRKARLSDYFTIAAAGAALISDGYQNNLMTMVNVMFGRLYPQDYTSDMSTMVSNSLLVGAILGQITVGVICDRLGRKAAIVLATLLIVLGATLQTASHGMSTLGMLWMFLVARGITGVGVGAEYPASSTSASEAANETMGKRRGPVFILVTNLPLSFGGPLATSIFLIVYTAAGSASANLEVVWRVMCGIGIALPLTVFYFRLRMLTTKLYKQGAIKKRVPYLLTLRYYWRTLIGTAGAWFLYDFVVFPNGVFSGTIISSVVSPGDIKATAEWTLLLGVLAIPGIFVGAYLVNKIGRKWTMLTGFVGYLVIGLIIGISYNQITQVVPAFVVMYGLMQSFGNLGPGDTLGLVSSESYATAVRGTMYGISAAVGKAGAAVGTAAFKPIQNNLGKRYTFIVAACCGLAGILVVLFFVPNLKGEDLAEEDAKFQAYLVANGWEGEVGEADGAHIVGSAAPVPTSTPLDEKAPSTP